MWQVLVVDSRFQRTNFQIICLLFAISLQCSPSLVTGGIHGKVGTYLNGIILDYGFLFSQFYPDMGIC